MDRKIESLTPPTGGSLSKSNISPFKNGANKGISLWSIFPGIINPSDGLTKALGWVLLSRHARRGMGHYRLGSTVSAPRPLLPPALGAGEGVGTQISATTVALSPAQDSPVMDRKIESLTPPTGGSLSIQSSG